MIQQAPLIDGDWRIVNDGVMGGLSAARVSVDDETLSFTGTLSLENNGGFSSTRRALAEPPAEAAGIRLEVRGDGRRYQLRLREGEAFDGVAWRVTFVADARWRALDWRFESFEPVFRGRPLPDAGPVDPARVGQVGFLIADGTAGPFRLDVRKLAFFDHPR